MLIIIVQENSMLVVLKDPQSDLPDVGTQLVCERFAVAVTERNIHCHLDEQSQSRR